MPTEEELIQMGQRVRPVMNEILENKGLVEVAEEKLYVTKLKGPLEDGWQETVEALAARLRSGPDSAGPADPSHFHAP
jgi:hypothetical protein